MPHRLIVLLSAGLLAGGYNVSAAAVVSDDFESATPGGVPAGWSDVGQAAGAPSRAPQPSVRVVATTDARGNPTRAVQIVNGRHNSQGIYRSIPNLPIVQVTVDLRVDQFALGSVQTASDWAWDVALSVDDPGDFAARPSMGVFASAQTKRVRTFTAGLSAPTEFDEFDLGGGVLAEAVWYRLRAIYNRETGVIHARLVNLETSAQVVAGFRQIPDWAGFAAEPEFTLFAIFDGELGASITRNNITTIDNVRVLADEPMLAIQPVSPGQIRLTAEGVPGSTFLLQSASSLPATVWDSVQTINFQLSPFQQTIPSAAAPKKFYRLRESNP